MPTDPSHIPVIVGVGQINDRPDDPEQGLNSAGLMAKALEIADADTQGGWLANIDALLVVEQISFPAIEDLPGDVANAIGALPRIARKTPGPMGDSPVRLLNEAANMIASGEADVVAVTGGEALRTAARRAATATGGTTRDHSAIRRSSEARRPPYGQRYGLVTPADLYPLYENATRAAWGQTLKEGQAESVTIWSNLSNVAAASEHAWIRKARTPEEILEVDDNNRPIAFPYSKFMVANSSVNQGAGFIVTSLARALERGLPEPRLVYIGKGAHADEPLNPLTRDSYAHSVSMEVSLQRALSLNNLSVADLDAVELYSCFPCVPKMARRTLGLPPEAQMTVFGGLTFGGGPIANYMSHAIACMVEKLRTSGRYGLLFANGGIATYNHTIVIGRDPKLAEGFPHHFDFQAEADQQRGPVPALDEDYEGPGQIETYTVLYDSTGAVKNGVILARSPEGARFLAKIPASDANAISRLLTGASHIIGMRGEARRNEDGDLIWK